MSESEPIFLSPHQAGRFPFGGAGPDIGPFAAFDRQELSTILAVYGRKVAAGEWRDYAIDALKEKAVFSVFRRATEYPLYTIEKQPKRDRRQGAYAVIAASGLIMKRGHDLAQVLRVIDRKPKLVVA